MTSRTVYSQTFNSTLARRRKFFFRIDARMYTSSLLNGYNIENMRKKGCATLQLGAVYVSIHSNRFSPLLANFLSSLLSFPGSLSVCTGYNGHFLETQSGSTRRGQLREKKEREKEKKGNYCTILTCVPSSEVEKLGLCEI